MKLGLYWFVKKLCVFNRCVRWICIVVMFFGIVVVWCVCREGLVIRGWIVVVFIWFVGVNK